jgi:hypothetical protein
MRAFKRRLRSDALDVGDVGSGISSDMLLPPVHNARFLTRAGINRWFGQLLTVNLSLL